MKKWELRRAYELERYGLGGHPDAPDAMRLGIYQPGNGTRYTVLAMRWSAPPPTSTVYPLTPVSLGELGYVPNGWLVVICMSVPGKAYLLADSGFLATSYVMSHFKIDSEEDANHITHLISRLIGRPSEFYVMPVGWDGIANLPVNEEV